MPLGASVVEVSERLESGQVSSEELLTDCLRRIEDPASEGARVFIRRNALALEDARRADVERAEAKRQGCPLASPLHGVPVSVKDLFDIEGQITTAGSVVLEDAPPAIQDSDLVARLKAAGAIIVGTTNMTEFAFSGLGINPHYGTPLNPFDRALARIPGGSSSGAAVSVTDGMAAVAIGTDTRGSCRIPAALCGLVGFRPTAKRVSTRGAIPLSKSLDSVGPLGVSVACCALVDAVIAGESEQRIPSARDLSGVRIGRLTNVVEDEIEARVASGYDSALAQMQAAGAQICDVRLAALEMLPEFLAGGGIAGAEAYAWHRDLLATKFAQYDPRISSRLLAGKEQSTDDYQTKLKLRGQMIEQANRETREFDLLAMPSVPATAPTIESLADEADYVRTNMLMLRNPGLASFLDRCAISLPIPGAGPLPVGLMLMGETMADRELFAIALAVEAALQR